MLGEACKLSELCNCCYCINFVSPELL